MTLRGKPGSTGYARIGCTAGDYDNDGFADLALRFRKTTSYLPLHNERNGTFKDVTTAAGIDGNVTALGLTDSRS